VRGGNKSNDVISVVVYCDYLCPYCRRLRLVIARLRQALGERLAYVFRHFPNEAAHPGASLIARASEAAAKQGRFRAHSTSAISPAIAARVPASRCITCSHPVSDSKARSTAST
jgi:Thioredoxin